MFPSPHGEFIFQIVDKMDENIETIKSFRPLTGNLYSKYRRERGIITWELVSVPSRGIYIPNI